MIKAELYAYIWYDWAKQVKAICDHLGLNKVKLIGSSGGKVLFDEICARTSLAKVHIFVHGRHPAMLSNMDEFVALILN